MVSGSRTLHASKEDGHKADASLFSPPVSTHVYKRGLVGTLCRSGTTLALPRPQEHWRREDMMRSTRDLRMVICLIFAALVAGCAGDRMSRSTEEAVDDTLLANKVKMALYADKQVRGRQITVEASQGVIQLSGVAASPTEAQRTVQIAQGIKGVKEVRNRLTVP
jgi:BON domain